MAGTLLRWGALLAAGLAAAAPARAEPRSWTGLYFGGHAGYAWPETDTDPFDLSGAAGGVHLGYLAQSGFFVGGVEVDYTFTDMSDSQTELFPITGPVTLTVDVHDLASVRVRAGAACDRWLAYGTVGYAWSDIDATFNVPALGVRETQSDELSGVVGGGGIEVWLADGISGRIEGLYYALDMHEEDDEINIGVVRAGISLRAPE